MAKTAPVVPVVALPSLRALPFLASPIPTDAVVLTDRQRRDLMRIGESLRLEPRAHIYQEGQAADSVFVVMDGVVKAYRDTPTGRRAVCAFLFRRDLFGLAENGRYVNSTQAISAAYLVRLPMVELATLLRHDGNLQFQFLTKVTHELRESHRRSLLITRRDATGRLARFVMMMAGRIETGNRSMHLVPLPMSRSDIAGYLALSLESVSRAAARLEHRMLVKFEGRHSVRILDPMGLARLAAAD